MLYDVGTDFTAHRNGWGAQSFMVEHLYFPSFESAKKLRDEYFERYHSTAKALTIAEQEGKFPPLPPGVENSKLKRFDPHDLAEWWAQKLDFSLLRASTTENPDENDEYAKLREALSLCPLKLIAFSKKYALRVLKELNLDKFFLLKMLCHIYDHNQIFVWRHADDRYACFHSSVIIECM